MSTSPHWYRWILLAGVWAMYCSFGLIVTSLAPLVGLIESDLDISHSAMGSVMGAWQLIFIISAIPCGILLDKVSTRSALTLGGLIIAASALARGFADSYAMLMIAVMLFGVGGPIISTGAPKVVTQHFDGQSRGLAMGIYMTGPSIGGVVSLTLTHSVLVPFFDDSWRAVMFLWAGFAAGVSILWWLLTTINPISKTQEDIHQGTLEAATAPLKANTNHYEFTSPTLGCVGAVDGCWCVYVQSWLDELVTGVARGRRTFRS